MAITSLVCWQLIIPHIDDGSISAACLVQGHLEPWYAKAHFTSDNKRATANFTNFAHKHANFYVNNNENCM